MIVALDGPAGSGKSTVSRAVAERLGGTYLDSGAMYRVVAWRVMTGVAPEDAARSTVIELGPRVLADGNDVTDLIRTQEISQTASEVAAMPEVRQALVEQQQRLLASGGTWVAEGRDIGTVVAPDAQLKVFLTASPQERANRRAAELGVDVEVVLHDQAVRDQRDQEREASPLKPASDAIELDTTGLSIEEVIDCVVALAEERGA